MTHAGDLREAYMTLFGTGSLHGAAGLVRDVLCAQARKETISGRVLLVQWLGGAMESVLSAFRDGRGLTTEELLPFLVHPHRNGLPPRVPDLADAIEAAGLPAGLCDDADLADELQRNLAGPG